MDDLTGSDLKQVSYSVVYMEPNHEATLQEERHEVVLEDTTVAAFTGWKITEFLAHLRRGLPIPKRWRDGNHPAGEFGYVPDSEHPVKYSKIPEPNYIRVHVTVVGRTPREARDLDHDRCQLRALDEIQKRLGPVQD